MGFVIIDGKEVHTSNLPYLNETITTIFAAKYCPCIHESVYGTISLHKTREDAINALENHKKKHRAEHDELYDGIKEDDDDYMSYEECIKYEAWDVFEIELLD